MRLNFRVISANSYLIAIYLSNCWKILRVRSLRSNLGVISAVITVFIIQELSDCRKIRPLRLNVRTISAVQLSTEYLPDRCIRVTVLLEYFDLLIMLQGPPPGAPWGPGKLPQLPPLLVALKRSQCNYTYSCI